MTLAEIADQVEWNLNREGLSAVPTLVRGWVRVAIGKWQRRAVWPPGVAGEPHNWTFLRASWQFNCAAGTQEYTCPDNLLRPIRLRLTVSGEAVRPVLGDYEYLLERWLGADNDVPSNYAIDREQGKLSMFPPPDDAYPALHRYLKKLPELTAEDGHNAFTDDFPDGIIAEATSWGFETLGHAEASTRWEARAVKALVGAVASDRAAMKEEDMVLFATPNVEGTAENPRPLSDELAPWQRHSIADP